MFGGLITWEPIIIMRWVILLPPICIFFTALQPTTACISVLHKRSADQVDAVQQDRMNALVAQRAVKTLDVSDDVTMIEYLSSFGYLRAKQELKDGLRLFQRYMRLPQTGEVDSATKSYVTRKRCSNRDSTTKKPKKIWEKTSINYGIASYPKKMRFTDVRELVKQAFSAWEIVIAIEFIEVRTAHNADIVIRFENTNPINNTDHSSFSVGSATGPVKSTIWLRESEKWDVFQKQEEGKIDLFLVLVHEIGHVLGLDHISDPNSVMFPVFQRKTGDELPVINSDDVERLRTIYDSPSNVKPSGKLNAASHEDDPDPKCPEALWTVTTAPSGKIFIFADNSVWTFNSSHEYVDGPQRLSKVFPNAPSRITVAVSDGLRVALIEDRDVYQYEEHEDGFRAVEGNPFKLHGRVLFFPSSAFPLTNTSVILMDGNVYATYNLRTNKPSLLGDKNVVFPHLPEDMRAGIMEGRHTTKPSYFMFTTDEVVQYDMNTKNVVKTTKLASFLKCK
ncbi:unnamed protein product [Bursaphelenchus okinawaensis]|uniref:Peptidase metallopeptidase domain-containing protein n=1 Tax=Bursaphelenchus okinawaensis TaxID=465554 RepID=A0A811K6S2_9BILA|nr:unnamed protein product [Bursaphelenchus okinawaensis]CAG9094119.1 unnamed protein product [Bursaphelenchus okinawaensis]